MIGSVQSRWVFPEKRSCKSERTWYNGDWFGIETQRKGGKTVSLRAKLYSYWMRSRPKSLSFWDASASSMNRVLPARTRFFPLSFGFRFQTSLHYTMFFRFCKTVFPGRPIGSAQTRSQKKQPVRLLFLRLPKIPFGAFGQVFCSLPRA